ncbi:fimbrial biogenesis outer membrane usher protein [Rahnella sp. BCC 1045]|uniref:fimbria/pilus outer membrane usher protein n=1 Tax=Rahnella sp. BCC 1045 TaxID=2816251 RepID=UPI001C27FA7D|nr:fimbria/pilus outer membrane usher protein [Rahnella sp. BCC 1045]MBU9819554.1 fimbrial biogenesis outer membrane usher protein [Rahnella sp. BCC 1045]
MPIRPLPRSGYQPKLYFRGSLCLLCLTTFAVQAQEYSSLPDAPRAAPVVTDAMFYLSVVVNGQTDNQVVPVTYRNNAYFVEAGVLAKNHVHINGQTGLINVGELPDVKARYDSGTQQLILQVPDAWLPNQNVSGDPLMNYTPSESSNGLLFNYDAYYTDPPGGARSVATWMEQRFFSSLGIVTNTGTYRYNIDSVSSNGGQTSQDGYLRYDTFWRFTDEKNLISYQVGDFVSDSLTWSNSARMGGIRISRNFAVRPDLVTYPLLQYSGTAAVPTTVDLFLNGFKASSNNLNSGPFTLTNVPYINGAGEATIVTTDAVGRQVSTSVPFYVSNTLLRKNLSDFDFSLGAVRQNYGLSNGDYSDAAFSGIYRYGLSNYLTLSGHTEIAQGLTLGGLGGDIAVGTWGTLSVSGSTSKADRPPVDGSNIPDNQSTYPNGANPGIPNASGEISNPLGVSATDKKDGSQYTLGYSYYSNIFSLSALRSKRTVGYQDITSYTSNTRLSRQADQVTFSTSPFGSSNGTMGIGYYDVEAYDNSHTRLVNFSYSRSLWGQSSMFLSLNKTLGDNGYSAQLQFIIPIGTNINMNAGVQRDSSGNYQEQIGASKATPTDGGLGWNLAYSGGNNPYQQADATWKSHYATVQGGFYGNQGDYTNWADLSGSVVFMANDWFLSDKINDAFIVVDTGHYADVPVLFENQKMGKTDSNGHLLIPTVSSYYPAKVEIDTLPLPADVVANNVNDRIAVKQGSGVIVKFSVEKVLSANITLHDKAGQPLKLGTLVTEQNSQQTTVTGYDGLVYFSHLQEHNVLNIQQEDHSVCRIGFDLDPKHQSIEQIGPLACPDTTAGTGAGDKS